MQVTINLELTKIPKELIYVGKKGKYIKIVVSEMKQPDEYGNTHTAYINQTAEQREAKEQKIYVGKGTAKTFEAKTETPKQAPAKQKQATKPAPAPEPDGFEEEETDLPF